MSTSTPATGALLRRGLEVVRHHVRLHPVPFAAAVAGALVYAVATVAASIVIGRVVDRVITPRFEEGEVASGTVLAGVVAIVVVGLVKSSGIVVRRVFATRMQALVQASLRERIVDRYLHLPLSFFNSNATGELIARAGQDVEAATMAIAPLPWATGVIVLLFIAAGWLLVTDVFLAAVGLVLLPSLLVLNIRFQQRMEAPAAEAQARFGDVSRVAYESIDGAAVVKVFGAEEAETARFAAAAETLREAKVRFARLQATFDALLNALPSVGIIALLVLGAWRVDRGAVTPGALVAFASLLNLLAWPLRLVGWVLGDLPRTVAGFDRVRSVLDAAARSSTSRRPLARPGVGLRATGVTYSHDDGTPALHDVTLHVPPGRVTALVGPTGCGKSTLLEVLAGLADPDAGRVEADEPVVLAFQEPFVFADSVLQNVVLGRDLPAGVYEEAVSVAQAAEFIERLPDGPASVIGERGATLSGGQRQRLALARALARQPRVLLLDDATSSVDASTESAILGALAGARRDMAVLMVATRPSTIAVADDVAYMEAGRIVATGTHRDLLRSVPNYAALVEAYEVDRVEAPAEGVA